MGFGHFAICRRNRKAGVLTDTALVHIGRIEQGARWAGPFQWLKDFCAKITVWSFWLGFDGFCGLLEDLGRFRSVFLQFLTELDLDDRFATVFEFRKPFQAQNCRKDWITARGSSGLWPSSTELIENDLPGSIAILEISVCNYWLICTEIGWVNSFLPIETVISTEKDRITSSWSKIERYFSLVSFLNRGNFTDIACRASKEHEIKSPFTNCFFRKKTPTISIRKRPRANSKAISLVVEQLWKLLK